jgi:hypothetical protein
MLLFNRFLNKFLNFVFEGYELWLSKIGIIFDLIFLKVMEKTDTEFDFFIIKSQFLEEYDFDSRPFNVANRQFLFFERKLYFWKRIQYKPSIFFYFVILTIVSFNEEPENQSFILEVDSCIITILQSFGIIMTALHKFGKKKVLSPKLSKTFCAEQNP